MKKLLFLILTLGSFSGFCDVWDELNETVAGSYSIETKGWFSKSFKLSLVPGRDKNKMGDMEFVSDEYGVCKGAYKLSHDDESFGMVAHVVESVNGIHCTNLVDRRYTWITVWIIFPKSTALNAGTGPVAGEIAIRYEGKEVLYKKANITLLD